MAQTQPPEDIFERLAGALKKEKKALLTGALRELPSLIEEKAALLSSFEAMMQGRNAGAIQSQKKRAVSIIRKLARENEIMLQHVRSGVKSAQERFARAGKEDGNVGAYGSNGGKLQMETAFVTRTTIA